MASREIPNDVKALLDQQHLLPALWYVGPLHGGDLREFEGPSRPIQPHPLEPAPATAPSDTGAPAPSEAPPIAAG
jgi:hypothetical protein